MNDTKQPYPVEVKATGDWKIYLKYSNGVEGEIKLVYLKDNPDYEYINDPARFNKVYIDQKSKDIGWKEGLSICKDAVYKQLELINMMGRLGLEIDK